MKSTITTYLVAIFFITIGLQVSAVPGKKEKSKNGTERQHDYEEAMTALRSQKFLLSFYAIVDKTGNLVELEPEGNFILVGNDKFVMQKSVSMVSNTFSGSGNFKGDFSNYHFKESKKGNVQFSFVISDGKRGLTFKGKMNKGDNVFEGVIKGKIEDHQIDVSGNVQPVQSHFVY
jgi:hypothetical protein